MMVVMPKSEPDVGQVERPVSPAAVMPVAPTPVVSVTPVTMMPVPPMAMVAMPSEHYLVAGACAGHSVTSGPTG